MPISNFQRRYEDDSSTDDLNVARISGENDLTSAERKRLDAIRVAWNFYDGFHWEDIEDTDSPQVTFNYCGLFVDKFVSFELGKGFSIEVPKYLERVEVTVNNTKIVEDVDEDRDGVIDREEQGKEIVREKYMGEFLEEVWENNHKDRLITEIGQTKGITGDAWLLVRFRSGEELGLRDPFNEFPNGKIEISVLPTQYVFPKTDEHDKDTIISMLIMYPIHKERPASKDIFGRTRTDTVMYKQYWTVDEIVVYEGTEQVDRMDNPYGFLPFVQIKNFPIAGRVHGKGDLEDVIPLNTEYNLKSSDVSEIIDYHSAPITLVYGAKVGNLEKGANKVWGGLPKDSKVENLGLSGDLVASQQYLSHVKTAMCEIGCNPETTIGGAQAISNTSGVALQYMNLPLVDKTNTKRICTKEGLERVNKMIIAIALQEGLIKRPDDISMVDFLKNSVNIPDTLQKDTLLELQQIQTEMLLGLECRHGALQRLGREDIEGKLAEVDREREDHPDLFNPALQQMMLESMGEVNSGMTNGQTPVEQVRTEITGQNGGGDIV